MDVMRKAIYMLSVLCVAALWGGCQRGGGEETAQVTLRLATRAATVTNQDGDLGNEGIKTLQIFLYRNEGGTYTFYRKDDVVENITAGAKTVTVELDDIKLGWYKFYAIANGASVGMESVQQEEGNVATELENLEIEDDGYFPKDADGIAGNGLPMAGVSGEVRVNSKSVSTTIPLYRAVAKLDITLTNETGTSLTVNEINFGAFGADRAFLFKQEGNDVPATEYKEIPFNGLNKEIGTDEEHNTANFTFYVYPSAAGKEAYTMGLNTEGKKYSPVSLLHNGRELTAMQRNTKYEINAIVDLDGIRFRNITVDDWGYSLAGGDINIGDINNNR